VSDGKGATLPITTRSFFSATGQKEALDFVVGPMRILVRRAGALRCQALHLTRRHRYAAFADLSSDKERLGKAFRR
jgi:hypothetical protein